MEHMVLVETIYQLTRLYIRLSSVGAISIYLASDEQFEQWVNLLRAFLPSLPAMTPPYPMPRRLEFIQLCQARGIRFALIELAPGEEEELAALTSEVESGLSGTPSIVDGVMSRNGHLSVPVERHGEEPATAWRGWGRNQ